jgi:hypothetical protein
MDASGEYDSDFDLIVRKLKRAHDRIVENGCKPDTNIIFEEFL